MKKIFHDIIPQEKRSIRNIPLTKKDGQNESSDMKTIDVTFEPNTTIQATVQAESGVKNNIKPSHNMDSIRPKFNIEPAFYKGSAKDFKDENGGKYTATVTDTESEEIEENDENCEESEKSEENFEEWNNHQKKSYVRATTVIVLCISLGFFLLATYFGGATISINPVRHDVVLEEAKIALNSINHETVTTKLDATEKVTANGTTKVDRKASGKIILYNAYNSAVQKLVADTRIETPNGLIYKLKAAASIPGQKMVNGKAVPGSIEVEVEASEVGEKYNQGFRDFTIVAYKGSDRYKDIYGRSKTALANGFSGTVPNIAVKDIASSTSIIKEKINADADEFFSKKAKDKGSNYVYIPSTKKVVFGEVKNEISKDGKTATLTIEAEATVVLFDSTTLFAEIIKNQSEQITKQIEGDSNFDSTKEIVYTGDFSKLNIKLDGETSLQVTGITSISSAIDTAKVTRAVSGLSKEQAIRAIKRLVELETIEIDIRPWWNKKLPDAKKIEIQTEE